MALDKNLSLKVSKWWTKRQTVFAIHNALQLAGLEFQIVITRLKKKTTHVKK